jgi:hypothetical protein
MRNRNRIFTMPPEQTPAPNVEGMVLVDAAEHRRTQHKLEEMQMRVAELGGRIDTLISLATTYKTVADGQQAAPVTQDDPEVEALAHRIDDAIAVLQGAKTASTPAAPVIPSAPVTDPNAPVV